LYGISSIARITAIGGSDAEVVRQGAALKERQGTGGETTGGASEFRGGMGVSMKGNKNSVPAITPREHLEFITKKFPAHGGYTYLYGAKVLVPIIDRQRAPGTDHNIHITRGMPR
jgi:hypothetical protein